MTEQTLSDDVLPELYELELDIAEVPQNSLLSLEQKHALMNLFSTDDLTTKRQLIIHNLRLVIRIAKHYSNREVALPDLVKVGTQGLIHALEHFELEGGFRFAAYAAKCVRNSIENFIMSRKNTLSLAAF